VSEIRQLSHKQNQRDEDAGKMKQEADSKDIELTVLEKGKEFYPNDVTAPA